MKSPARLNSGGERAGQAPAGTFLTAEPGFDARSAPVPHAGFDFRFVHVPTIAAKLDRHEGRRRRTTGGTTIR